MRTYTSMLIVFCFAVITPSCRKHEAEHKEHEEQRRKKKDQERVKLSAKAIKVLGLKTVRVEQRGLRSVLRLTGQIEFNKNTLVHVSPRVSGRVVKVHKLLGEDVLKGDVLAELDSVALGKLKLKFLEAQTELKLAATTFAREKRLRTQKITSEREYLLAQATLARARMRLNSAHEILHLMGLSEKEIRAIRYGAHQYTRVILRAPMSGRIIGKQLANGELINPGDKAYTVADLAEVWAQVDITEGDVAGVFRGMEARVFARSYPGHWFPGKIALISSSADPQTRTLRGRIAVKNTSLGKRRFPLRNKMYIEAEIFLQKRGQERKLLVVPQVAVQRYKTGYIVFVEEKPGEYEVRPVVLGDVFAGRVAISTGVRLGEKVVTNGAFSLKAEYAKNELGGGHSH